MATIRIDLSKNWTFEKDYNEKDVESVKAMVRDYFAFYTEYRRTHSISAKMWRFPSVVINGDEKYKVTPNGSWYDEKENRKVFG